MPIIMNDCVACGKPPSLVITDSLLDYGELGIGCRSCAENGKNRMLWDVRESCFAEATEEWNRRNPTDARQVQEGLQGEKNNANNDK